MKTLYININNEQIQSNEELEVLKQDLDSDFFFYLGEKIAKDYKVENENALITDFNTQENEEDYKQIIAQWKEIKGILFGDECEGKFELTFPNGYIRWLRYSEKYNDVYDSNFSHGEPAVITIDLGDLYEDSVEALQRKILRKLQCDDLYLEIDEIVFNDDAVTRKSPIIRTIKEKYDGIGFKAYKKWLQGSKLQKGNNIPDVGTPNNPINKLLPLYNIFLGKTTYFEIKEKLGLEDYPTSYIPIQGIEFSIGGPFRKSHAYTSVTLKILPEEWKKLGIIESSSIEEMKECFLNLGFDYYPIEDVEMLELLEQKNEQTLFFGFDTIEGHYSVYVEFKYNFFDHISIQFLEKDDCDEKTTLYEVESYECPVCSGNLTQIGLVTYVCVNCSRPWVRTFTKRCPQCESTNIIHYLYDSACLDCNIGWNVMLKFMKCPNCNSTKVNHDGSNNFQFSCNDCYEVWGMTDAECPSCHSKNTRRISKGNYHCDNCGHDW